EEPSTETRHLLQTDPRLARIAVEDGRPIGFSVGFVRNKLWFLADLFVLPEAQSRGVGGELLKRCLAAGAKRGACALAVASSHDQSAQALHQVRDGSALPPIRNRGRRREARRSTHHRYRRQTRPLGKAGFQRAGFAG